MKLVRMIGIGLAICVPAVAVAFAVPNAAFKSGAVISAAQINANFDAIAKELTDLRSQLVTAQNDLVTAKKDITTLKSDVASFRGAFPQTVLTTLTLAQPEVSYTAQSAGVVATVAGGSGYAGVGTRIVIGGNTVARAEDGNNVQAFMAKGQVVTLSGDFPSASGASIKISWYALEASGKPPQ